MKTAAPARNPVLDVIRIFAFFCVVSVHFFLNSIYYELPVTGMEMYLATFLRSFFVICVPLFLMLSGYLMGRKKPTREYYVKIVRILGEYVLASLFCMACRAAKEGGSVSDMVRSFFLQSFGILSYQSAKYGWYVEMYIGLFLLIPYLNILYNGLPDKGGKQRLILTMLFLTGIPEVVNSLRFSLPWTMTLNDPTEFLTLLPNWWGNMYPVTCYFLGAYLREYPPKPSGAKNAALLLGVFLAAGTVNCALNAGKTFLYAPWQDYRSLFTIAQAFLVFRLFLQLDLRNIRPLWLPTMQYYIVVVPLVALCSLATAFFLVSLYKLLEKAFRCRKTGCTRI